MSVFFHHFLLGAGGAATLEALKLWELQGKLNEAKFRKLLTSYVMWIPLIAMLAASGFVAWAYYESAPSTDTWNIVLAGIAARTLAREVVSTKLSHGKIKLGPDDNGVTVRDFFA
jgi:hypothetical protein